MEEDEITISLLGHHALNTYHESWLDAKAIGMVVRKKTFDLLGLKEKMGIAFDDDILSEAFVKFVLKQQDASSCGSGAYGK
jgi:hypothetical protein